MKREIFLKKIELTGCPYRETEKYRLNSVGEPYVWLTDDRETLADLKKQGNCVVYLLTADNRNGFCPEADWCLEAEDPCKEDWMDMTFFWRVWLRSRDLPWQICETPRLYLREMTEEDLTFLYHCQTDPDTARFVEGPREDRETELEKLQAYRKLIYGFYGFGLWMVCEKESGRPVGRAGLQLREEEELPELGFEMEASFRGRGFMKEALEAVMAYAREELELDRLRAVVDVDNAASQHVCRSLGFAEAFRRQEQGRQWIFFEKEIGI